MISYFLQEVIDCRADKVFIDKAEPYFFNSVDRLVSMLKDHESFDFIDQEEVRCFENLIRFIQVVLNSEMGFERKQRIKFNRKLLGKLVGFMTSNFYKHKHSVSLSESESNSKQMYLKERINNEDNKYYFVIAKAWLNIYLVFKQSQVKLNDFNIKMPTKTKIIRDVKTVDKLPTSQPSERDIDEMFELKDMDQGLVRKPNKFIKSEYINPNPKTELKSVYSRESGERMSMRNESEHELKAGFEDESKAIEDGKIIEEEYNKEQNSNEEDVVNLEGDRRDVTVADNSSNRQRDSNHENDCLVDNSAFYEVKQVSEGNRYVIEDRVSKRFTLRSNVPMQEETEENLFELAKSNKYSITHEIIQLIKLLLRKNSDEMRTNFLESYTDLAEFTAKPEKLLKKFADKCIPSLENQGTVGYDSETEEFLKKTKGERSIDKKILRLKETFVSPEKNNLNLIHNIIIAFNSAETLKIQQELINLIYKYFNQRKKFFRFILNLNQQIVDINCKNVSLESNNSIKEVKNKFLQFFKEYEEKKHNFEGFDGRKSLDFLNVQLNSVIALNGLVLLFCKQDVIKHSDLFMDDQTEEHHNSSEAIYAKKRTVLEWIGSKKGYTEGMEDLIELYYIYRNPFARKEIFNSVANLFDQNNFIRSLLSVLRDLVHRRVTSFVSAESQANVAYCKLFGLAIILMLTCFGKDKKALEFIKQSIIGNKRMLFADKYLCLISLKAQCEMESERFNFDYFKVMDNLKKFQRFYPRKELFNDQFAKMYADIMLSVVRYVIQDDIIIGEADLEALIVDNTTFLIMHVDECKLPDKVRFSIIELLRTVLGVDSLFKIFINLLNNAPELKDKMPSVDVILSDFFNLSDLDKFHDSWTYCYDSLFYCLLYLIEIDSVMDMSNPDSNDQVVVVFQALIAGQNTVPDRFPNEQKQVNLIFKSEIYIVFLHLVLHFASKSERRAEILALDFSKTRELLENRLKSFVDRMINTVEYVDSAEFYLFVIEKTLFFNEKSKEGVILEEDTVNSLEEVRERFAKQVNNYVKSESDGYSQFKHALLENKDKIQELGNSESESFVYHILFLLKENRAIFNNFLKNLVNFVKKSTLQIKTAKTVKINNFLLFSLTNLLEYYSENAEICGVSPNTLKDLQIQLEKTGMVEKLMGLVAINQDLVVNRQLPMFFLVFNKLLEGGNEVSQESFYKNFTKTVESEKVFKFFSDLIGSKIDDILTDRNKIIRKKKKDVIQEDFCFQDEDCLNKLDSLVLRFLQLLCENHNEKLQNYLRYQKDFKKPFDLVSLTNSYLQTLYNNYEPQNFEPLLNAFDLLIEFIQGPCLSNQIILINSKLLITLSDILNSYIKTTAEKTGLMTMPQISILTYKSSILLLSLVEARTKEDPIYEELVSVVKKETLNKVCQVIYNQLVYCKNTIGYSDQTLLEYGNLEGKAEEVEEMATEGGADQIEDCLIVETGFNLYFLSKYIEDHNNRRPQQFQSTTDEMEETKTRSALFSTNNIIYMFLLFCYNLVKSLLVMLWTLFCYALHYISFKSIPNLKTRRTDRLREETSCFSFYKHFTRSIEVLRENVVYKIYFLVLPFCKNLTKFEKTKFIENMDRTNSKTKLLEILKLSNILKFELEIDYRVKNKLKLIPFVGVVFEHIGLWKDSSLILNVFQNLVNLLGVRRIKRNGEEVLEKQLFGMDPSAVDSLVEYLALIQVFLVVIIVSEFLLRKVPPIYKLIEQEAEEFRGFQRTIFFFTQVLFKIFLSFEILYYFAYITFAFLGRFSNDFFFAFLLFEIVLRFKTLKNVLMSIRNPINELILTFILWIILTYYFSLLAYLFIPKDFAEGDCDHLLECLTVIFYENNKNDNGIASYLTSIPVGKANKNPVPFRFWYDQLFNLIIKVLIVQMVSGIIIDNFAKLRNEEIEMITDKKNVCTVCSQERDEIEKIYEKFRKSYADHIKQDHNLFNYVYYIIFIYKKDSTEYTGMESYVSDMVFRQKDITWIPINRMYMSEEERD